MMALSLLGLPLSAHAATHEVKMLNGANGTMHFDPAMLTVAPGDTVRFLPTSPSHNAEAIKGMLPDGVEPFVGKMNEEISVTFDQPGLYGFKCKPHYAMGMVGVIIVGDPVNAETAKAVNHPVKAKELLASLLAKVGG
jgi:pseudoazurin